MEAVQLATLVLITVLLIASALAWVVAGRLLAPLRALDDTARSISETDLTRRIPVSGADEIAELSRTFNAMVDRLEGAFASQRAFVSDASHELRTPITIVRGHLELLGDDPQERRETVALVTDELDRMSRFVDDLLLLAKAERSDFLRVDEVELGALTDELLDKAAARRSAPGRSRRGREARCTPTASASPRRSWGWRRTPSSTPRTATRSGSDRGVDGGEARCGSATAARASPREDQDRIFDRFARAAASRRRSEGAGLGLAIVRAIAEAHGGRADAGQPARRRVHLHRRRSRLWTGGLPLSRILIAEDEPRLSSFLVKGLKAAGYTTTVARTASAPPTSPARRSST